MILKNKFKVDRIYNMEEISDKLYAQGKKEKIFNHLYNLIIGEDNILLAMKNIKLNINRNTKGSDGKTIADYENISTEKLIQIVKQRFVRFRPMKVRRIFIPKSNGTQRSLGILTFEDRLIQQCVKQILEPICEAKFHSNSFGFRPLRSTKHAISKMTLLMQMTKYDYCVDIDIKDFFDNVDRDVLMNQIYNLGIRDKKLLSILSKMFKVEIEGEGILKNGLVQGGVLSPLLSNIVLNELDWWINSQCKMRDNNQNLVNRIYFIRYADDFRILCKTYSDAFKVFNTVKLWLKEKLHLNISQEKSKILNLKTQGSEFLGFKIKSSMKNGMYSVESYISESNKLKIKNTLCNIISRINNNGNNAEKVLNELNKQIATLHNYYESATNVNKDFSIIAEQCKTLLDDKLKNIAREVSFESASMGIKTYQINGITLIPIEYVNYKKPEYFPQDMNIYTKIGRQKANTLKLSKNSISKYKFEKQKNNESEIENINLKGESSDFGLMERLNNFLLRVEKYLIFSL